MICGSVIRKYQTEELQLSGTVKILEKGSINQQQLERKTSIKTSNLAPETTCVSSEVLQTAEWNSKREGPSMVLEINRHCFLASCAINILLEGEGGPASQTSVVLKGWILIQVWSYQRRPTASTPAPPRIRRPVRKAEGRSHLRKVLSRSAGVHLHSEV